MSLAGKEWTHLHVAVTPFLCELRSYKDTSFSASWSTFILTFLFLSFHCLTEGVTRQENWRTEQLAVGLALLKCTNWLRNHVHSLCIAVLYMLQAKITWMAGIVLKKKPFKGALPDHIPVWNIDRGDLFKRLERVLKPFGFFEENIEILPWWLRSWARYCRWHNWS